MKGEFKGDFSRDTFYPSKHFLRVLMQQGRVSLDADWNEQVDILLHYMQTLAEDIIGPFAGPADKLGFGVGEYSDLGFSIGYGRYYVDGILCENIEEILCGKSEAAKSEGAAPVAYYNQPDYPVDENSLPHSNNPEDFPCLVYLDVWERHISSVEDDYIREKALGGPDTASRSKIVWQVKVRSNKDNWWKVKGKDPSCENIGTYWGSVEETLQQPLPYRGCLKARTIEPVDETDPCITSPDARYRGEENQLYRVEIHRGGGALEISQKNGAAMGPTATFKWSRDNGSVVFPIISKNGMDVFLEHVGRDDRSSLKVDDRVEIIDDRYTLLSLSRPPSMEIRRLAQVEAVDLNEMKVTLRADSEQNASLDPIRDITYSKDNYNHPLLRRWDHQESDRTEKDQPKMAEDGALFVEKGWLNLENGIQVFFGSEDNYYAGDYWLIPARTATGNVEWPKNKKGDEIFIPPHGIDHHYAPLAVLILEAGSDKWVPTDCRSLITRAKRILPQ